MIDPDVGLLRRYVLRREAGTPAAEWSWWLPDIVAGMAAWVGSTEREAREHAYWRRERRLGEPWCPWLGRHTVIADDVRLQAAFLAVPDHGYGWKTMANAVRRRPTICLREWRESGRRLIAATRASAEGRIVPGKLQGWPMKRGTGVRTLLGPR